MNLSVDCTSAILDLYSHKPNVIVVVCTLSINPVGIGGGGVNTRRPYESQKPKGIF